MCSSQMPAQINTVTVDLKISCRICECSHWPRLNEFLCWHFLLLAVLMECCHQVNIISVSFSDKGFAWLMWRCIPWNNEVNTTPLFGAKSSLKIPRVSHDHLKLRRSEMNLRIAEACIKGSSSTQIRFRMC